MSAAAWWQYFEADQAFFQNKYLSFPGSQKRGEGHVGGKSCREHWCWQVSHWANPVLPSWLVISLLIITNIVIDAVNVKDSRMVGLKCDGGRIGVHLRRRGATPVKQNLPVDHVLGEEPLG